MEKRPTHWVPTLIGTWVSCCSIGDTLLLFFLLRGNLAILASTLRSHFETGVMGGWPDPCGESMEGRPDGSLARKLSTFHTVDNSVTVLYNIYKFLIEINCRFAVNMFSKVLLKVYVGFCTLRNLNFECTTSTPLR